MSDLGEAPKRGPPTAPAPGIAEGQETFPSPRTESSPKGADIPHPPNRPMPAVAAGSWEKKLCNKIMLSK